MQKKKVWNAFNTTCKAIIDILFPCTTCIYYYTVDASASTE